MMMAIAGLLRKDLIEWMTCMTYQSASGAGAQNMRELLQQMGEVHLAAKELLRPDRRYWISTVKSPASCATSASYRALWRATRGSLIPWVLKTWAMASARKNGRRCETTRSSAARPNRFPSIDLRARRRDALHSRR